MGDMDDEIGVARHEPDRIKVTQELTHLPAGA